MDKQPLKIYIYYCSSNLEMAAPMLRYSEGEDELKVIPLPCSGKIDILYLTKSFENGADGVALITCKQGECRYLEGDLRARKRAEAIDALLEETGLSRGRITIIQMKDGGIEQVLREVDDFITRIKTLSDRYKVPTSRS